MARQKSQPLTIPLTLEEHAVKYRWLSIISVPLSIGMGAHMWVLIRPYWLTGAWIVLFIFWLTALMELYSAVKGWVVWFRNRGK